MVISIINAIQATYIFIVIFVMAILLSAHFRKDNKFFPIETTNELKGVAILLVVFGHIGYFLVNDHNFLFPLSSIAGVGVDIFLFLSGYGLVVSAITKSRTIGQFYKDRLVKLMVPFWLVISAFFLLDFFVLNKAYPIGYIVSSFFGLFNSADLYKDINSPLWYFTLILFYYIVFPIVFIKRRPWISALIIYVLTYVIIALNPVWLSKVRYFHEVHMLAFPLGVLAGGAVCNTFNFRQKISNKIESIVKSNRVMGIVKNTVYCFLALILLFIIAHNTYNSGVGQGVRVEQIITMATTLAFVFLFLIKKIEFRLLNLIGLYSYEIYLLHWPILYRYDFIFPFFSPWLAMSVYIALFIGLGWLLQKLSNLITRKILKR